ncbi:hypothetical protein Tco_0547810 [Tanacetum coccineum]
MDNTRAQQKALDDELVAPADRLKIRKSNLRLRSILKSKEPTLQVALDALKLTPFYNAFEISADVPEIYMQEFWVTVSRHHSSTPVFKLNGKSHTTVDYVYLLWEDLVYQVENKNSKKNNDMYYLRFTKVIVDYFMAKDQVIPMRNKMFWHYVRDDFMFTTVRVISKHQDTQVYGAILPQHLTNQAMLESEAYMTYRAYATGEKTPKPKTTKKKADSESSPKMKSTQASKGKRITTLAKGDKPAKKKQSATKSKGLTVLSEVALTEAQQMKIAIERSKIQTHSSHATGSGDGVDTQLKVPDEPQQNISGTLEGAVTTKGSRCTPNTDQRVKKNLGHSVKERMMKKMMSMTVKMTMTSMTMKMTMTMMMKMMIKRMSVEKLNQMMTEMVSTPPDYEITDEEENQEDDDNVMGGEQEDEEDEELNNPCSNIPNFASLFGFERRVSSLETELSELKQTNQFAEVVSSILGIVDNYLASKMKDEVNMAIQLKSNKLIEEAQAKNDEFLKQIDSNIKAIIKDQVKAQVSKIMPKVEKYVTESLGAEMLARSSNQPQTSYAAAASLSEFELKKILIDKIDENNLMTIDEEPSMIKIEDEKKEVKAKEVSFKRSNKKEVDDLEEPSHQEFNTGNDDVSPAREVTDVDARLWNLPGSQTPDREWNKTKTVDDRPPQSWMTQLAQASGTQSMFNEFLATPIDFSAFIMNRLKINNLTQDVLTVSRSWSSLATNIWKRLLFEDRTISCTSFEKATSKDFVAKTLKICYFLVQGKLTNLNLDERFALNVALRMYTRRIVIQERVEDLQLAVESYQKKINLQKPDSYRSYLRKMTPYTAYPDIQGIIYQDDMDINRLMHTNELHKFSDGTLNHVRTALNDIATGIQMEYLPKRKWTKQDKQRARVMIKCMTETQRLKVVA